MQGYAQEAESPAAQQRRLVGTVAASEPRRTMNDDANETRQMMESLVERMTSLACRVGVTTPEPRANAKTADVQRDTLVAAQREITGLLNEAFKQLSLLETIA